MMKVFAGARGAWCAVLAGVAALAAAPAFADDDDGELDYSVYASSATVVLPDTVTAIPANAMQGFTSLRKITIPSNVTDIAVCAFAGCTNLAEVVFDGTRLQTLGAGAFSNCTSLAKIELPATLQYLNRQAFAGCVSLPSTFTVPENVVSLGAGVFQGDTQITFVRYLGNLPRSVDTNLYAGTSANLRSGCLRFRTGWSTAGTYAGKSSGSGSGSGAESGSESGGGSSSGSGTVDDDGDDENDDDDDGDDENEYPDPDFELEAPLAAEPHNAGAASATIPRTASAAVTVLEDFPRNWPSGKYARRLYVWNASFTNYFKVKLDAGKGSVGTNDTSTILYYWRTPVRTFGTLPEPELEGFEFNGWEKVAGSGVYVGSGDAVTASCTLYASWSEDGASDRDGFDALTYGAVAFPATNTTAAAFTGYLLSDGLAGTATLKIAKGGKATFTAKLYETGKTYKLTGKIDDDGTLEASYASRSGDEEFGLELEVTTEGFSGTFGEYEVDGALNITKANRARLAQWAGSRCAAFTDGESAAPGALSIKVAASGKVSAKGWLPDGTALSASASLIVGDGCAAAPLYFKKPGLACILWLDRTAPALVQFSDSAYESLAFGYPAPLQGDEAAWSLDADEFAFPDDWEMMDEYFPGSMDLAISGGRLVSPKAGKVKYSRADEDFAVTGNEDNPSGLKLAYAPATGIVKGTFKAYRQMSETRMKALGANVNGVVVKGIGYLSATIKSVGTAPATLESDWTEPDSDDDEDAEDDAE